MSNLKRGRTFGRNSSRRKALFQALAISLIEHEGIKTTLPKDIYRWFMEMFVDSSEWVMVPNVFGMGTFADGGIMSTKPYTCGSNYVLKMSNYKKGPWCEVLDGLYWRFTEKHRDFYESNPRLSILTRSLDKMNPERKERIFGLADEFIKKNSL